MSETVTRETYLANLHSRHQKSFEKHKVTRAEEGRWLLAGWDATQKKHSGFLWVEVICLHGGGLYVDGDIAPVTFRYGPTDPIARVHWMGSRPNAWDHYFVEKAHIGTGDRRPLEDWVHDVAVDDLQSMERERVQELSELGGSPSACTFLHALREANEILSENRCEPHQARHLMESHMVERGLWEEVEGVGVVPSARMMTAHATLSRLSSLLSEKP